MKKNSTYEYILIGLAVRLLRHCEVDPPKEFLINHIEILIGQLEKANFNVSLAGIFKIREIKEQLEEDSITNVPDKDTLKYLSDEMKLVERVIYSEARTKNVYTLPERRYNTDSLLNNPQNLLKSGTFDKLSDIAKFDIKSGSRCILFGEATASAFHTLRATEDTLKQYYYHHKKQKRLKKPMWGPMTAELKSKTRNKPPQIILDSLDLVRVSYRNPTQHPDATYDIDGAQDLFGVCVDLINKMAQEI